MQKRFCQTVILLLIGTQESSKGLPEAYQ